MHNSLFTLFLTTSWNRRHRESVRSGYGDLVRSYCHPRDCGIGSASPSLAFLSPYLCLRNVCRQQASFHRSFRIGSALYNGLRSTFCRSRTLWEKGYPRILGLSRFSGTSLQLFWPGSSSFEPPESAFQPFYGLVPKPLLYPMVILATTASVIASQALISGLFSLAQQAIDLGFCPRLRIVHTSQEIKGQIYVPAVNYSLMIACLGVVIGFGKSSGLAGAYGIAVTGTMIITATLFFILISRRWRWSLWKSVPLVALFLIFDVSYFLANLLKIVDGGWFTLLTAILLTIFMTTWRKGRAEMMQRVGTRLPLKLFLEDMPRHHIPGYRALRFLCRFTRKIRPPSFYITLSIQKSYMKGWCSFRSSPRIFRSCR